MSIACALSRWSEKGVRFFDAVCFCIRIMLMLFGRTHLFRKRRNLQNVRAKYRHYRGGANIKCEVKAIGPELAQKVRQLHALWGESRYERMAWGSGIGHVVIILQGQGKESIALYDRPVWEEKQDMRKVFYCRDVYGEESACRYSCFLRVYRLLQNLLITECKQTK